MPQAYVQKLAKEKGMSIASAEKKWDRAKELANEEGKKDDFAYITGIFKKMMKEQKTYKQLTEQISRSQLKAIERGLDKLFSKVDVDVEFTKHFLDRLNDKRNGKDITDTELRDMYQAVYKLHGPKFKNLGDGFEAMLKDFNSNINIPFVLKFDKKNNEVDLIAKTVMRKKDFKTGTPIMKVY